MQPSANGATTRYDSNGKPIKTDWRKSKQKRRDRQRRQRRELRAYSIHVSDRRK